MQAVEVALQGDDDALRAFAGGDGAGELGDGARRIAGGGGVDDAVYGQLGGVADDRFDVVNVDLGLAGGVQRQLLDFAARHGAIGADARNQHLARVGGDPDAGGLQHLGE